MEEIFGGDEDVRVRDGVEGGEQHEDEGRIHCSSGVPLDIAEIALRLPWSSFMAVDNNIARLAF